MFIVKKPRPVEFVSYRLVLVPDSMLSDRDALGQPIKSGMSVVNACAAYEPTQDDLSSIGYAPQATMAELREAADHMRDRAEKAERERDNWEERARATSCDLVVARAEFERLTAPVEGEPTVGELVEAWVRFEGLGPQGVARFALEQWRAGVAHERARQQPKNRATDEELVGVYTRGYDTLAHADRYPFSKSHYDCKRAAVAAVADRVRQETR